MAYITAPWGGNEYENTERAARYCRQVYDAGYSPVCPLLFLPLFLRDAIPQASIAEQKRKLDDLLAGREERGAWMDRFLQFEGMEELSRKVVVQLIQSIHVLGKKNLRITFNYKDEYQEAVAALAATRQRKAG